MTWERQVSKHRFEAYSEELIVTYPHHFPYKHGSSRHKGKVATKSNVNSRQRLKF